MKKSEYLPYLRTLRRVPDDIILSVATREIDVGANQSCVCGWVIREALARRDDVDARDVVANAGTEYMCHDRFGGTQDEWEEVYYGVCDDRMPAIERAFVERIAECVS